MVDLKGRGDLPPVQARALPNVCSLAKTRDSRPSSQTKPRPLEPWIPVEWASSTIRWPFRSGRSSSIVSTISQMGARSPSML